MLLRKILRKVAHNACCFDRVIQIRTSKIKHTNTFNFLSTLFSLKEQKSTKSAGIIYFQLYFRHCNGT